MLFVVMTNSISIFVVWREKKKRLSKIKYFIRRDEEFSLEYMYYTI